MAHPLPQDWSQDFAARAGELWINTAHQGVLPSVAAEAAREAVAWKQSPWQMTTSRFIEVPTQLKSALGQLIGVPAEQIILTNGASYGVHLLANGIPLQQGDDVLLMQGDFPSNLLPWLGLRKRGVSVRLIQPAERVLSPTEVETALTPATRVVCLSWVHSFSGHTLDLNAIGAACRRHGTWLVVNTTQGLGARPLQVSKMPIDAVVNSGWKWLCGPYGTGFAWLREELLQQLQYNQAYWLNTQTADDLGRPQVEPTLPEGLGARRYDLFGTANFFNFKPFAAAVDYLLSRPLERVHAHVDGLVEQLVQGLDRTRFELVSPESGWRRSSLVFFRSLDGEDASRLQPLLAEQGIHLAYRNGCLRASPHVHNTSADIERLLAALHRQG
jgi:selenocysteine lyase/cysteine desulfurase